MNRLHHLRQTLPLNLQQNQQQTTRFLILDYNSDDGLQQYILQHFPLELKQGRLSYHRYTPVKYFDHSHSRNLAVRCTQVGIVCNVDADNFIGPDFDQYLQETFAQHPGAVISALANERQSCGAFGRIAVHRNHFIAVGGYDEQFEGYGFEDYDLVSRLERSGHERITINNADYLQTLTHDHAERIARVWITSQFQSLYRQQVTGTVQVLMYLFKDNTLHYGLVEENLTTNIHFRYSLAGDQWQKGTWKENDQYLYITLPGFEASFEKNGVYLTGHHHYLKLESDPVKVQEAIMFHTNMGNCCLYLQNERKQRIRVNEQGFGDGSTESFLIHH